MSLSLIQTYSAVTFNVTSSFAGQGGTAPYSYAVLAGGAGGTINASTGIYTAPSFSVETPQGSVDTIQVTDALSATANLPIKICTPLLLVCDIIQTQMGLADGRVYVWDQKINAPIDNDIYVAVSIPLCKPFGNNIDFTNNSGLGAFQSVNVMGTVDVDIISRGPGARDKKEFVLMALNSIYSEQQQEANSFHIARLSTNFINLSNVDGAAIPYRYKISFHIQYAVTNQVQVPYFSSFDTPTVAVNP